MAAQLALFVLIYRLVVSHQHLNRIPGILRVGVGVGVGVDVGVSAGVLVEAVYRH